MEFTWPQKKPYAMMDLYPNNNGGWDMFYIYKIYIVVQNAGNGLNRKHTYRSNSNECKDLKSWPQFTDTSLYQSRRCLGKQYAITLDRYTDISDTTPIENAWEKKYLTYLTALTQINARFKS